MAKIPALQKLTHIYYYISKNGDGCDALCITTFICFCPNQKNRQILCFQEYYKIYPST